MYKYSFFNDYSEGAHPSILKALAEHNLEQQIGYGYDKFSQSAKKKIRSNLGTDSDIYFISGGTQANLICLSSMLRPFESVIAAVTGHIVVHEAGAIEATGHKINTVETSDGKLNPALVEKVVKIHEDEHMVKPKVVFISNSTEIGTHYSKSEISELSKYCQKNALYLYLDGARLACGLTARNSDLTLGDIAELTDIFYIGGTKNGALLGEAIVVNNSAFKPDFIRNIKQKGGLLAKGQILGIQFDILFENNLYFELGKHANQMAEMLTKGIKDMGFDFQTNSVTNQIFPIMDNNLISELQNLYGFYVWSKVDNEQSSIRLVTSWTTSEDVVEEFLCDLKNLKIN